MKDNEIKNIWEQFTQSEKYKKYFISYEDEWNNNLEKVKQYIDDSQKRPSTTDDNSTIKTMAYWTNHQIINYKNNEIKNEYIKSEWESFISEYKNYFMTNEEIWKHNLEKLKEYIDKNNKKPSDKDIDENVKRLGLWLITQIKNYAKKERIMKDTTIRKVWEDFVTKYKTYFTLNNELWKTNLTKAQNYIDEYNKRPSTNDKSKNVRQISEWISSQLTNYKKNENIMKDETIKHQWEQFTVKYKDHFMSSDELWKNNLEKVKKYINDNECRPSHHSKDENTKHLGSWISTQVKNYNKDKTTNVEWEEFILSEKYKKYFKTTNKI